MRSLWLFCFPLLFMPNFGLAHATPFGVLEMSDLVIVPFILLLMLAPSSDERQRGSHLNLMMLAFLVWSSLSTLSIEARYIYLNSTPVVVGCFVKLARLALYTIAGILISRKIINGGVRNQWLWSLLAASVMLSLGLLVSMGGVTTELMSSDAGYKSYNAVIVSVAILGAYISGLWIENAASSAWRSAALPVVAFAICSVALSSSQTTHGRGGWIALIAGCGYLFWKNIRKIQTFAVVLFLAVIVFGAYLTLPDFRSLIEATISSSNEAQDFELEGVDNGGRPATWLHEAPKLINAPLLGTGFYHRGAISGLWNTGSHNFFIQMFLETGLVGGFLVIAIFVVMWRHASSSGSQRSRQSVATRAALVTAIVGGMSGEYYYGGVTVLLLFAVFAVVGAERLVATKILSGNHDRELHGWQRVAS
jgi:O-antigen ligase